MKKNLRAPLIMRFHAEAVERRKRLAAVSDDEHVAEMADEAAAFVATELTEAALPHWPVASRRRTLAKSVCGGILRL